MGHAEGIDILFHYISRLEASNSALFCFLLNDKRVAIVLMHLHGGMDV